MLPEGSELPNMGLPFLSFYPPVGVPAGQLELAAGFGKVGNSSIRLTEEPLGNSL